ncbi:MAG: tRNA (adenosine(37)-N6)-dimethylallyltransferase MiaA [Candidatus Omnitrophota bacterium]
MPHVKVKKEKRLNKKKKVIFIVGPTGVGKTETGLKLAEFFPCEFVSADSMQVYKGMDVASDKLPLAMRRRYPHHLVDVIALSKDYDVARFCKMALKAIGEIFEKKRIPVVIGGTGLYIESLIYGICQVSAKDKNVRLRIEEEIDRMGLDYAHEKLKGIDAVCAQRISCHDRHRIARALEVYELTGRPFSVQQERKGGLLSRYEVFQFGLRRDRSELYERIDQRVDFMINSGLLDEVRLVLKKKLSKTAYCCIGVREIEGFLKGEYDLTEAVRLIKRNSRHFAKRQLTWFNKNKDIEWIDLGKNFGAQDAAKLIFERIADRI